MAVFDQHVLTPNEQFYVRWHWSNIPSDINPAAFRLRIHGQVNRPLDLSLKALRALGGVDLVAVNQCSGNSRGFFQPRVPGAQWGNGAMGNARWTGVPLRRVLDAAGVKAGAVEVRFNGLDGPATPDGPDFRKSLAVDHALDGEVMIAYAMNGEALPYLNGFPLRLVVPGWFSTYWVKMLSDIEVLAKPDDNYWMQKAYLIPNTPGASIRPGQTGVEMMPIKGMGPRSFFTNLKSGDTVSADRPREVRGIAFGGTSGVARVELSQDQGRSWQAAQLGEDLGRYSFRRWTTSLALPKGPANLLVRCTSLAGETQPQAANWNASGYMRNVVENLAINVV